MLDYSPLYDVRFSYPRRQQYRRLSRAGVALVGSAIAAVLAFLAAGVGAVLPAGVLGVVAVGFAFSARHWLTLADRSRVGARSEDEVRRVLAPLRRDGWRVGHALSWSGRGDIDSVAIAPGRIGFAIEVKTRSYEVRHLALARAQAAWLGRFRRRSCRYRVVPVLCVARGHGLHRWEDGVLVVSIDLVVPALLAASPPIERVALPF